jgi:glycosyltransferase involved in cell wall biosynthesis
MGKFLKFCIFTETYYPVVGGGETQARQLAEGLSARNFQAIVLTRRTDPSQKKVESYGAVTVFRLPPVGRQHWKKWGLLLTGFPALIRFREEYHIILVSGFRVIGAAAVLASLILGKVCILKADNNGEMSGGFFTGGLARTGLKTGSFPVSLFLKIRNVLLRRADAFVAVSSDIQNEFIQQGIRPSQKIHRIPNSVDNSLFRPVSASEKREIRNQLDISGKTKLVIFTGRLVSYKGLPMLLRVWERIREKHPNAGLVLVGGGSLDIHNCETELRDYVQIRNLQESVFFAGEVHNVHTYLQASDIFVFPTEKEAFGISLIEAMACGLPVIATAVGGLKDILEHGKNGWVVRAGDEDGLHQALHRMLSDPVLAESLGQTARQTVQERYSAQQVTQAYVDLFKKLLATA